MHIPRVIFIILFAACSAHVLVKIRNEFFILCYFMVACICTLARHCEKGNRSLCFKLIRAFKYHLSAQLLLTLLYALRSG